MKILSFITIVLMILQFSGKAQSGELNIKNASFIGIGTNIGRTLLWNTRSYDQDNHIGLIANVFNEYVYGKRIYKIRVNYTGEFIVLEADNLEEQIEFALLAGWYFEKESIIC